MLKKLAFAALALCAASAFPQAKAKADLPDAGEWKPIDNRKALVWGEKITEANLFRQPIIVMKFDPTERIKSEDRETEEVQRKLLVHEQIGTVELRFQVVNVFSKKCSNDEVADFLKNVGKTAVDRLGPVYSDFGLVKEPENEEKKFPFYYVVGIDGKILYSGNVGPKAMSAATRDARAGKAHPILGYFTTEEFPEITEKLALGEPFDPIVKKLTPIAAAKADSPQKQAAAGILAEIEQSKAYWFVQVRSRLSVNPPETVALINDICKSYPREKRRFEALSRSYLSNPIAQKAVKTYMQILAIKNKPPEKKSDIAKAYALVQNAERQCQKVQKELGMRTPRAMQVLENLVAEVKMTLEGLGAGQK